MSDQQPRRPAARRPPLHHTVLRIAAGATAAATLVWSGLFYSAVTKHAAASTPTTGSTPSSGATSTTSPSTPTLTPVTTSTS